MLIAVTGTPGTGKSHFAIRLSDFLGSTPVIEINDIVEKYGLFSGTDSHGTRVVKMSQLKGRLSREIKKSKGPLIIVGHLAADLELRYDICVVTRANLSRLASVFKDRGYDREKARENLFAEALDYCGIEGEKKAKETYEVETQKDKKEVIDYIRARLENKRVKRPDIGRISKMDELLHKIKSKGMNL
jgi:broad-specificity NMP kinase